MKLNGGFTATVSGIMFASSLGWGAYLTRELGAAQASLAKVEEHIEAVDERSERLQVLLDKWQERTDARLNTLHDLILTMQGLHPISPPGKRNP